VDASRDPVTRETKALLGGIQVVELERAYASAIAAEPATSAGFVDKDLLDTSPAIGDVLASTHLASIGPARVYSEAH
jgi:hypothetical protein